MDTVKSIDIAIIGGGAAGLTAAIYAARGGANTVVFERMSVGGQAAITPDIENYPAFKRIEGFDLGLKMAEHAEHVGASIVYDEVMVLDLAGKTVQTGSAVYRAKAVILAMGASPRKLGLLNEQRFTGRGISYCATCDGSFYKGKRVAVVGGGNTAVEDALYLSGIASEVFLVHRRDSFRAEKVLVDKMKGVPNIKLLLNSVVSDVVGDTALNAVNISAVTTAAFSAGAKQQLKVDGVFVAVGNIPNSTLVEGQVELSNGYIVVDREQQTSLPHVFAAGDVTNTVLKQVITAAADGARAATFALKSL